MAYNSKYTSIKTIVEKAFRDAGMDNIDWESAVEWSVELLGLMGVNALYMDKYTSGRNGFPEPIMVEDFRFKLPDDLVSLKSMRRVYTDPNGQITGYDEMIESSNVFQANEPAPEETGSGYFPPTFSHPTLEDDNGDYIIVDQNVVIDNNYESTSTIYSYKVDGMYVFTDFKDGFVEVAYTGIPIDDEGYPLIPGDPKLLEALKYHLIFKIDWKRWRANPESPGMRALVNDSEQRRDFYVGAARNKAHIPTIDKMEAIKNQWLRTIPRINEHANGFDTLDVQEQRYNELSRPTRRGI